MAGICCRGRPVRQCWAVAVDASDVDQKPLVPRGVCEMKLVTAGSSSHDPTLLVCPGGEMPCCGVGGSVDMTTYFIDEIARRKERDVIVILCGPPSEATQAEVEAVGRVRDLIVVWLAARQINWEPCFGYYSGDVAERYAGHMFVDVPYSMQHPDFVALHRLLTNEDGSGRTVGISLGVCRLHSAVRNLLARGAPVRSVRQSGVP